MPALLTGASQMMCPHGGMVTATPASTRATIDAPILRASDTFIVAGCTFQLPTTPPTPSPCVGINWVQTATRVKHGGDFALTEASVGLCVAGTQAPQGPVVIQTTQPLVNGL
jgi:hypothetical protein